MKTYASVNSKPDYPSGRAPENFLKGRIPHPQNTMKVQNPDSWGRKIMLKSHPQGNDFQKSSKRTTNIRLKLRKTVLKC